MSGIMFVPYEKKYELACIALLKSNLGSFFAREEVADFILFLQNQTSTTPYFVGLLDDKVVACGGWEFKDSCCFLRWGMINGEQHGRGLGTNLLKFRIDSITRQNKNIEIAIRTSGQAQGFYKKFGFEVESISRDGISRGIDEYVMKRPASA